MLIGAAGKLPLSVEGETEIWDHLKAGSKKVEVCFQMFLYFSKSKLAAEAV